MTKKRKDAPTKHIARDGQAFDTYEEKLQYEERLSDAELKNDQIRP